MVYIANYGDGSVSVKNGTAQQYHSYLNSVGTNPIAITVNPSTHMVYVATHNDNAISAINGTSEKVIDGGKSPVGTNPIAIAVDPSTHMVYVANEGDKSVSLVDGSRGLVHIKDIWYNWYKKLYGH